MLSTAVKILVSLGLELPSMVSVPFGAKRGLNLLTLAASLLLSGCYTIKQGAKQLSLFTSQIPVEEALSDSSKLSDKQKDKLRTMQDILKFAASEGLNTDGAYTSYIHLDRDVITYLVFASPKVSLNKKTWWFPIVGSVPYLGFFDKIERDEYATKLEDKGFDVHRSGSAAFSSLGWFEDPVYAPMLKRSLGRLAHLFIHELTHRTVWIKSDTKFNERLAEFCARKLTQKYLANKEEENRNYQIFHQDRLVFKKWLKILKESLSQVYDNKDLSDDTKLKEKMRIITSHTKDKRPSFQKYDFVGKSPWNNARISAASVYSPDFEVFERAYQGFQNRKFVSFLTAIEKAFEEHGVSSKALESLSVTTK